SADPLELDDATTKVVALALVGPQIDDVVDGQLAHVRPRLRQSRAGGRPPAPLGQLMVSSAAWKRPAWLFSAPASVSSHSAISSRASSRAVLAKPGYISVYS